MKVTKIQLDLACERLRKAIRENAASDAASEVERKWARMALMSSNRKLGNHGGRVSV